LTFTTIACKEEDKNSINGTVYSYPESELISNISVTLDAKLIDQGSFSNTWSNVGNTTTDNSGTFNFSFDALRVNIYKLSLSGEQYRTKIIEFEPTDFAAEYNFNETMVKDASLEIYIKNNILPKSESDEIRIRVSDIPEECNDCSEEVFTILTGSDIDTTLIYQIVGDDEIHFEYTIVKGESTYSSSYIYMNANQINTKEIIF
jgi:hypothetical protein